MKRSYKGGKSMFCQECGTRIEDDLMFCPNCGTKVGTEPIPVFAGSQEEKTHSAPSQSLETSTGEAVFCPHCGALNHNGDPFCANCGGSLDGSSASKPVKKIKLPWVAGGIAVVVILVVLGIVGIFTATGKTGGSSNEIYYIKDESLCRSSLKKIEPVEIDDDLIGSDLSGETIFIGEKYSEDKRYLFYFHTDSNWETDLYYIDTKDKDLEPQKIDSNISGYHYEITPDNKVIYCKNENLYIHDLNDKEKIASDVTAFYMSEDGENITWITSDEESRLYTQDTALKNEKEKLDSGVDYIVSSSPDLKYIVYKKEDSVYLIRDLSEKEKIDSDVIEVVSVAYDSSGVQVLYSEGEGEEAVLWDFVMDDMSEDDDMEEPDEKDYQTTRIEKRWGREYEVTEISDEYYEKYEEYQEKIRRDICRDKLRSTPVSVNNVTLQLYDSDTDEETAISEGYLSEILGLGDISGKALATYKYVDEENMPVLKFSDIYENGSSSAYDSLDFEMQENAVQYLVVGENTGQVLDEDKTLGYMQSDGDRLYAITYETNSNNEAVDYELGEITIDSEDFGSYNKLYSDAMALLFCEGNDLIYIKDLDEEYDACDLYINDDKIDSDVNAASVYYADNGHVMYLKDCEEGIGTLKLYNGKSSEKIADDVNQALYFDDRRIAVLMDLSKKSRRGDLKLYNGKELEKIDTDVSRIIIF